MQNKTLRHCQYLCVCVCVCAHILVERLQRLPPADPLTGGAMSQRSAGVKSRHVTKYCGGTPDSARFHWCVCVCVCVCARVCVQTCAPVGCDAAR